MIITLNIHQDTFGPTKGFSKTNVAIPIIMLILESRITPESINILLMKTPIKLVVMKTRIETAT